MIKLKEFPNILTIFFRIDSCEICATVACSEKAKGNLHFKANLRSDFVILILGNYTDVCYNI